MASNWVIARSPARIINYDIRNPPASRVIQTYAYRGPPVVTCGNPVAKITDDLTGYDLSFLSATYNSTLNTIVISMPDKNMAQKGNYSLRIFFTQPGSFDFSLGLNLNVIDVCDNY